LCTPWEGEKRKRYRTGSFRRQAIKRRRSPSVLLKKEARPMPFSRKKEKVRNAAPSRDEKRLILYTKNKKEKRTPLVDARRACGQKKKMRRPPFRG